jgi:hypothetical protein
VEKSGVLVNGGEEDSVAVSAVVLVVSAKNIEGELQ